ncbi:MAG: glycosyltransferase family 4 protein [Muribaculaceae bacterium]|nr:glycosyltransferase family 4 protein [Muribaculaceae bacterium]
MKILYCLAGTFNSGGMERIVIQKANWLSEHGYDVIIATTEQNGQDNFFDINKKIRRIDLDVNYSKTVGYNVLKKIFKRKHLMRIHKRKLASILELEEPNIVISTFGNEIEFLYKLKDRSKKIAEIHFSKWFRLQYNRKGLWRLIDKYLTWKDNKILSYYNKFICLTNEDKKNWEGHSNIVQIPNFIEEITEIPAKLDNKSMIAVGRLSYQKGFDRLIKSWKIVNQKYPDWKLHIYGDGEKGDELLNLIESLNLENCIYIHKPEKEIRYRYLENSALLLTSHYEGLPMVLIEGMSVGLPLISFDCQCGPSDVITDGLNGYLVPDGDIDTFADRIFKIIENEPKRKEMGKNSLIESKKYDKQNIMKQWEQLFQEINENKQ